MLDYTLVENLLTPAPDDYMAQAVNVRSYSEKEIAERILKSGAGLTKSDILSVLEAYNQIIGDIIIEGGAVTTGLFNAYPSIMGVFNSATDSFDAKRHRVKVNLTPGISLRTAFTKVKTQKILVAEPLPSILEVKDMVSGSVNELLTPGGVMRITGSRLKLFNENPANGIFLIDEQGGEIQLTVIIDNKPARLMAMLPADLSQEHYTLEVRTSFLNSTKESKTLKTGRFHKELTNMIQGH